MSFNLSNKLMKEKLDKASEIVDTLKFAKQVLCSHKQDLYRVATVTDEDFRNQVAANTMNIYRSRMHGRKNYFKDNLFIGLFEVDPLGVKNKRNPIKRAKTRKTLAEAGGTPGLLEPRSKNSTEIGTLPVPLTEEFQSVPHSSGVRKEESEPLNFLEHLGNKVKLKIIVFLCQDEDAEDKVLSADFCVVGDFLCWRFPDEEIVHTISIAKLKMSPTDIEKSIISDGRPTESRRPDMGPETIDYASGGSKSHDSNAPSHKNKIMPNAATPIAVEAVVGLSQMAQSAEENEINSRRALDSIQDIEEEESESAELVSPKDMISPGPNRSGLDQESDSTNPNNRELRLQRKMSEMSQDQRLQSVSKPLYDRRQNVEWSYHTTATINLEKIIESNTDKLNTHLSELPKSTQLSIARKRATKNGEELSVHYSLLQITVGNRVIIYDLGVTQEPTIKMVSRKGYCGLLRLLRCQKRILIQTDPEEVLFFNATQQLVDPHFHVDTGFCMT